MLMPFRSTLDEVYRAQIEPCLREVAPQVGRADDVARAGYIVCEQICRQIQESHLIAAELSCDNPNVFYELGLAYAIGRHIVVLIQQSQPRESILRSLALQEIVTKYTPFTPLKPDTVKVWRRTLLTDSVGIDAGSNFDASPGARKVDGGLQEPHADKPIEAERVFVLLGDTQPFRETIGGQEFHYGVEGLCAGGIRRALDCLKEGKDDKGRLTFAVSPATVLKEEGGYISGDRELAFEDVERGIAAAPYVLIGISFKNPVSYFWLGFAHGLQKEVVPITVLPPEKGSRIKYISRDKTSSSGTAAKEPGSPGASSQNGGNSADTGIIQEFELPFDTRALWHVQFRCDRPDDLQAQIMNILRTIAGDRQRAYWRRRFWKPFLDEGTASVFVGSVELTQAKRHVVGEWDYRTVSELTAFLTAEQETMRIVIQTPTFQALAQILGDKGKTEEQRKAEFEEMRPDYVNGLRAQLEAGNSIVIASADVNDMTEVALATYAVVDPFTPESREKRGFSGVVAFKNAEAFPTQSTFFQIDTNVGVNRGFRIYSGEKRAVLKEFATPYVPYAEQTSFGYSSYYGHIAKFQMRESKRWVLVLQGITGPATLGLVQVLTGVTQRQFVVFNDPEKDNDQELLKLLQRVLDNEKGDPPQGLADVVDGLRNPVPSGERGGAPTPKIIDDFRLRLTKHSEDLTRRMVEHFEPDKPVEAIFRVFLSDSRDKYHDERKVIWWDIAMKTPEIPAVGPH